MNIERAYDTMVSSLQYTKINEDGSDVDAWITTVLAMPITIKKKVNRLQELLFQIDFYSRYTKYFAEDYSSITLDMTIDDLSERECDSQIKIIQLKNVCDSLEKSRVVLMKKITTLMPFAR